MSIVNKCVTPCASPTRLGEGREGACPAGGYCWRRPICEQEAEAAAEAFIEADTWSETPLRRSGSLWIGKDDVR